MTLPPLLVETILVVEDDSAMRTLLMRVLRDNGYHTVAARDGREMWAALEANSVDLVLLDVMLPGVNGLDLCRTVHESRQIPIIIISARGDEMDRVLGLEIGADDYLPKPFGWKELLARVRAVLRRGQQGLEATPTRGESLLFAGWTLDLRRRELADDRGAQVELSGAEYDLLLSFLENAQRVMSRDRLLELSRARLGDVSDRSIDVLVSRLRRKLAADNADRQLIRTVRGRGYMFIANVVRD